MLRSRITILSLSLLLVAAVAGAGHHSKSDESSIKGDIVDTAVAAGSFGTLAAALDAAGLVDALKGDGPFTVFAPTDEAFAKLPEGTVEMLLEPENLDKLKSILTYHVVAGSLASGDVVASAGATTLQGGEISFTAEDGAVRVNDSNVVAVDVEASNGVIHVIDTVLMP